VKLHDRTYVDGTTPSIYIGHPQYKSKKTGNTVVCQTWYAEYGMDGKKYGESLKTSNKAAAVRAAHRIVSRLERGEVRQIIQKVEWEKMRDDYIGFIRMKNRAPKTIEKYEYVIECFVDFAKEGKRHRPDMVTPADFWRFSQKMRDSQLHLKTVEDRLIIVKQWFKWATVKAKPPLLAVNVWVLEEIEEAESSPQPCFTPEQVAKLLSLSRVYSF
jgi:hypothetical protein